ncbi:MAG TPA: serine hydrolase domain-containing protein [Vicinamibacteria bacterium]|nr:serine hydrolase domain-containing protein [Vicinamibacteria bacterium]
MGILVLVGTRHVAGAPPDTFVADTRAYLTRLEKLGFAGVVLVASKGAPLVADGYGLADRERKIRWTPGTVSSIGSITKQFTAAAILALEEDGRLRTEDPITKHIEGVPEDKRSITLHQLLTHSSGIVDLRGADDFDPIGREEFVRRAMAQPLAFPPGRGFEYSNAGFSLLGVIVEKLTAGSWERYARERLFLPQSMYETGYVLASWGEGRFAQGYRGAERWGTILERPMRADGPYWILHANGGVHATAYDMLRWAEALRSGRVLKPASLEKLWSPHVAEPSGSHYGYGWDIRALADGSKLVTHNGGNGIHYADFAIVPSAGAVVFLQTNVMADVPVGQSLLGPLVERLLAGRPYLDVPDRIAVAPERLRGLEGAYRLAGDQGAWRFTAEAGGLVAEAEGPLAFSRLHSSRPVDEGRAGRLCKLIEEVSAAALRGDFEPMSRSRGGDVPSAALAQRYGEWRREQEAGKGPLLECRALGAVFQPERDVTLVRCRFEKGTADRAFVWDATGERLQGVSLRGLETRLTLVPVGVDAFMTWDRGFSPSKPVVFGRTPDGRQRATLGSGESGVEAVRAAPR